MSLLRPLEPSDRNAAVSIWNTACGGGLAITLRFVEYNNHPATGAVQAGRIAVLEGQAAGFVLASALPKDPPTSPPQVGWIDAIAVNPAFQHRGLGSTLMAWGEQWLRDEGCNKARLGGSLHPFTPGYPNELDDIAFFTKRGYVERAGGGEVWDVARDLEDYPMSQPPAGVEIRPMQPGEEDTLLHFLQREFPNRWRFEYQEFLRESGRISDWIILLTERGVDGFASLTFEDSIQPINRYYPYRLPRPWGQLGPIGVSADVRGKEFGRALLDGALGHLRDRGVRGAVIDWTSLVGFYSRFGFQPYRRYTIMSKILRHI